MAKKGVRAKRSKGVVKNVSKMIGNTCKCVEIVPTVALNVNTAYLQLKAGITGARAPNIAQYFGLYRIAKVIYTFRPFADTFTSGVPATGNNATTVPSLYLAMNRYGDIPPAFDGNYMRAMGAKPRRLDDKNIVFSYTPNIIQSQQNTAGTTASSIKMAPWLSTDDLVADGNFTLSTALHYGHSLFVEAQAAGTAQGPVCQMDVKVIYEFKEPRLSRAAQAQAQEALDHKFDVVTLAV